MPTILKTKNSVTTTVVPTTLQQGELAVNITDKKLWVGNAATTPVQLLGAGVTGDVVGPASATDNAVARFDATTGKLIQNSLVTVSDTGAISAPVDASISGLTVGKGLGGITSNTVVGLQALNANTSGTLNTAVGNVAVRDNTTGAGNSGFGYAALVQNTTGGSNTAIGSQTLYSNTTASNNTAVGYQAGYSNTTGASVDAFGYQALYSNTTGVNNSAFGFFALQLNTTGTRNNAFGRGALAANTTGSNNTSMGISSLNANTTGSNNVAFGDTALLSNTTASNNTAIGYQAGYTSNRTADVFGYNVFVGSGAGFSATTGQNNTFVGGFAGNAVTSGSKNTILGRYDGNQGGLDIRTANNHIVLSDGDGNPRVYVNASGDILVPRTYNNTVGSAANMFVDSNGSYARSTSSLKYKKDVQNATHGLTEVLQLRPVTYKGKSVSDGDKVFGGLIAEEVDAAGLTEFVQYAEDGTPDALAYGNMVALCIKAIQELNAKVEAQALEIATLKGN